MKNTYLIPLAGIVLIMGCGPKSTVIAEDLSNLKEIQPAIDKLSNKDKGLLDLYFARMLAESSPSGSIIIPKGMTIGKAIKEQKKFVAEAQKKSMQNYRQLRKNQRGA
ncbi:MAG: hypothetical protein LBC63_03870 [Holophagales bacterium]|jgi:hypothetical protein|nr:hypothetical protein [Holophagales bacterium]